MRTKTHKEIDEIIKRVASELLSARNNLREQFIRTWISETVPIEHINVEYLVKNVELVERHNSDGTVSFFMRYRNEK